MGKSMKGFSLVSALVAMGIIAAASTALLKVNEETVKTQKRSEVFQNALSLETRISIALIDSNSCRDSLAPAGDTLIVHEQDKEIKIMGRDGTPLFEARDEPYFNNTIKIESIKLINVSLPAAAAGNPNFRYGQTDVNVSYRKISKTLKQEGTLYNRTLGASISIKTDLAGNLDSCYSLEDNAVATAKKEICEDLGGRINLVNGECELIPNQAPPTNPNDNDNVAVLDNVYVNRIGDTVDGPLTLGASAPLNTQAAITADAPINANAKLNANAGIDIPAGQKMCVVDANGATTKCVDLTQSCGPNEIFRGDYNMDGSPICINSTCNANEYFVGDNPDGTRKCVPVPSSQCGPGEYIVEVQANGAIVCGIIPEAGQGNCATGEFLQGYNADGTKNCQPGLAPNQGCTPPEVLQGFNSAGNPVCVAPQGVTGVEVQEFKLGRAWTEPGPSQNAGDSSVEAQDYDFCFLSGMAGEDGYKDSSYRECRVTRSGSTWRLISNHDESRSVMCAMQCINVCSGPQDGYWQTVSTGTCSCPQQGQGGLQSIIGTQTVTQECRNAKCGGSCDPADRVVSRSCTCQPSCPAPKVICPQIGNQCVSVSACIQAGGNPQEISQ